MNIIDVRNTIPKKNYSASVTKKIGIVYHITADDNKGQCLRWFQNPKARVSAHYIVEPDGDIHYCVDVKHKAYHAGIVKSPTAKIIKDRMWANPNSYMIGIEVVSKGKDLTQEQYNSIYELTEKLTEENDIPLNRHHLIGHNEINIRDKYFCPIKSYHPNDIIRFIQLKREYENRINNLEETANRKENTIQLLRKRLKRFIQNLRG